MARTTEIIELTASDRQALEALLRSPKTAQSLVLRVRIILMSAGGEPVEAIASATKTSTKAVYKWRSRYKKSGIEGLSDLPRSGQPRKLTDQKVKEVLKLTVERIPHEATHWSVRLMAKYARTTT